MFRVGQKVVCVDASATYIGCFVPLNKNEIYTVLALDGDPAPFTGILLVEVKNPHNGTGCFFARRFRPVVDRPTSIEFAYEILRKETAPHTNEMPA